jgi:hypothetical protein
MKKKTACWELNLKLNLTDAALTDCPLEGRKSTFTTILE